MLWKRARQVTCFISSWGKLRRRICKHSFLTSLNLSYFWVRLNKMCARNKHGGNWNCVSALETIHSLWFICFLKRKYEIGQTPPPPHKNVRQFLKRWRNVVKSFAQLWICVISDFLWISDVLLVFEKHRAAAGSSRRVESLHHPNCIVLRLWMKWIKFMPNIWNISNWSKISSD